MFLSGLPSGASSFGVHLWFEHLRAKCHRASGDVQVRRLRRMGSEDDTPIGFFTVFPIKVATIIHSYPRLSTITLWLFNIAMEHGPFIDDFPIKTSIYKGFSMAMLNNQRVSIIHWLP